MRKFVSVYTILFNIIVNTYCSHGSIQIYKINNTLIVHVEDDLNTD